MKRIITSSYQTLYVLIIFLGFYSSSFGQCLPNLGTSSNFVLFTTTGAIGNTGTSKITGDIGTNAGAVTGFNAPSVVNGFIAIANGATSQASSDLIAAYNQLYALTPTTLSHPPAFGTETLTPGIYGVGGAGSVGGILVLDGLGNSNAVFVFKIGGAMTVGAASIISLVNGTKASNVFWMVDGAISMGAGTTMSGTLIANGAISMGDGGILKGRLLSTTGAIAVYNVVSDVQGIEIADAVGGTVSTNQTLCSGYFPSDLTLSGFLGSVTQWEKSTDTTFTSPVAIFSMTSILAGSTIGNLTSTTYFRAKVQNTNCTIAYSSFVTVTIGATTIWNGTSWSNGNPTTNSTAIISGNYNSTENLVACNLRVTNNAVVLIPSGTTITINDALIVDNGSSFTLSNNANLIQGGLSNNNSGSISVSRNSSSLMRLDYTFWSSPVAVQNLLSFSPLTLLTRFYKYSSSANIFESIAPTTSTFETAKGYLIRMPNNHSTSPTIWSSQFLGIPNNGSYTIDVINNTYNAFGNPYPSTLDADTFILNNNLVEGLYFWRKTNNTDNSSYATYTLAGGTANQGGLSAIEPNGVIQIGQGFITKTSSNHIYFTNAMRIANNNNQFFRNITFEKHRIWLNLSGENFAANQLLISYMTGATNGIDPGIDGSYINDSPIALNSYLNNGEYIIQGRALPFTDADVIPLTFKTTITANYTIAIDHLDGLFLGNQNIFIRDIFTGIVHNLKQSAYSFTTTTGTFNNRFEIVFTNLLENTTFSKNNVQVYSNNGEIIINSGLVLMDNLKTYDIRGALIDFKDAINASEIRLPKSNAKEVVLLKITTIEGELVILKTILY